jgi:hypothetical protein
MFTRALNWSLLWARSIQSILVSVSLISISILSYHLHIALPSCLFPSGFPTKILQAFTFSPCVLHALPISSSLTWPF